MGFRVWGLGQDLSSSKGRAFGLAFVVWTRGCRASRVQGFRA